jgi:hypothetical protein
VAQCCRVVLAGGPASLCGLGAAHSQRPAGHSGLYCACCLQYCACCLQYIHTWRGRMHKHHTHDSIASDGVCGSDHTVTHVGAHMPELSCCKLQYTAYAYVTWLRHAAAAAVAAAPAVAAIATSSFARWWLNTAVHTPSWRRHAAACKAASGACLQLLCHALETRWPHQQYLAATKPQVTLHSDGITVVGSTVEGARGHVGGLWLSVRVCVPLPGVAVVQPWLS